MRLGLAVIPVLALMNSCGGGSGGSAPAAPTWTLGQFAAESTFAASCVTPRTGNDALTGKPYPDHQGKLLDELNWLRSWTNDLYLWYSEVADQNPAGFATDASYFDVLKTTAKTASGSDKDRFHFTQGTAAWEALEQSGVQAGYGVAFVALATTPPRNVVVGYIEPLIPADNAAANIARGAKVLTVDGVDLVNAPDQAGVDTLNAGLTPKSAGESHSFSILDAGAVTPRTVTLVSADVTVTPVQNVHTIAAPGGSLVGYMLFNDHLATSESALVNAFTQFHTTTQGFSVTAGQALPTLGLSRVFVLTGTSTCSASESIINSLQGVGVQVIQIGSTTCGKPYGFYPTDNCGTTYFSIQFQGVNAKGFGDYPDGFTPANTLTPQGVSVPGCSVADDFTHALGDSAEGRLASALSYRQNGVCPVPPSGFAAPPALAAGAYVPPMADGQAIKSLWQQNRMQRRSSAQ
jgi:hypothetical protein